MLLRRQTRAIQPCKYLFKRFRQHPSRNTPRTHLGGWCEECSSHVWSAHFKEVYQQHSLTYLVRFLRCFLLSRFSYIYTLDCIKVSDWTHICELLCAVISNGSKRQVVLMMAANVGEESGCLNSSFFFRANCYNWPNELIFFTNLSFSFDKILGIRRTMRTAQAKYFRCIFFNDRECGEKTTANCLNILLWISVSDSIFYCKTITILNIFWFYTRVVAFICYLYRQNIASNV